MSSLDVAALAVPKGSLVLVTGANGLVGSHIADQYLHYGYRVRGTARDTDKNAWLVDFFRARYGEGSFELFKVPDMNAEGAYDDAVKGVSVFAHSASVVNLDHDPNNVIPPTIAGAVNALKAAYAEPSVKRFVLTSSSTAVVSIAKGRAGITASEKTWNEESVKAAWAPPPYTPERAWEVYGASKTQAEQEVWKYHEEHRRERPDLVVNAVLPSTNLGHPVAPAHQGYPSSSALPLFLWKGEVSDALKASPTQFFVDTADNGRLHVAAGILENVKDRRILGLGGRWTLDRILEILRRLEPGKAFPENFSGDEDPNEVEGLDRSELLLRDLGRPGWTTLEESIGGLVEDLRKSHP